MIIRHWKKILLMAALLVCVLSQNVMAANDSTYITVTNSYANVRSSPGANNKYLGKVYKGQKYTLLDQGKAPNGKVWYKAEYNGKTGWICSSFASLSSDVKDDIKDDQQYGKLTVTGNPVRIRDGAGLEHKRISSTSRGKIFQITGSGKDKNGTVWYKIKYDGDKEGWIISTFVKLGEDKSVKPVAVDNSDHSHGSLIGTFTATAYCGIEGGGENYYTANGYCLKGKSRTEARTVAVDPRKIKLGTKLYIEFPAPYQSFNGIYYARDTGGAIKGNKIDLYIGYSNIKDAYNFGVRKGVKVYYG